MTVSDSSRTAALPKRGKRAKPAQGIDAEVAVLQHMTVDELRRRYAAVMGEESRCRHKKHLIRKIAWRIQALAEGDLTERARRRAKELANDADVRVTPPKGHRVAACGGKTAEADMAPDNRLPTAGDAIVRTYKGRQVRVVVLANAATKGDILVFAVVSSPPRCPKCDGQAATGWLSPPLAPARG